MNELFVQVCVYLPFREWLAAYVEETERCPIDSGVLGKKTLVYATSLE